MSGAQEGAMLVAVMQAASGGAAYDVVLINAGEAPLRNVTATFTAYVELSDELLQVGRGTRSYGSIEGHGYATLIRDTAARSEGYVRIEVEAVGPTGDHLFTSRRVDLEMIEARRAAYIDALGREAWGIDA